MKAIMVRMESDNKAEALARLARLDGVSVSKEVEKAVDMMLETRIADLEGEVRQVLVGVRDLIQGANGHSTQGSTA